MIVAGCKCGWSSEVQRNMLGQLCFLDGMLLRGCPRCERPDSVRIWEKVIGVPLRQFALTDHLKRNGMGNVPGV